VEGEVGEDLSAVGEERYARPGWGRTGARSVVIEPKSVLIPVMNR